MADQSVKDAPTQKGKKEIPANTRPEPDQNCRTSAAYDWGKDLFHEFKKLGQWLAILGAVFAVVYAFILGSQKLADEAVDKKLSDPALLRKIAAESRPALLFDANESFIADLGAKQYVTSLSIVERGGIETNMPTLIRVDFNRVFTTPPIITTPYNVHHVTASRSKGASWDFRIDWGSSWPELHNADLVFRLELIP